MIDEHTVRDSDAIKAEALLRLRPGVAAASRPGELRILRITAELCKLICSNPTT